MSKVQKDPVIDIFRFFMITLLMLFGFTYSYIGIFLYSKQLNKNPCCKKSIESSKSTGKL